MILTTLIVASAWLILLTPVDRRINGRHLSRPLSRRFGRLRVGLVQVFLQAAVALLLIAPLFWAPTILQSSLVVWLLDDLITGGRDKGDRKRWWAKAKLRMPKPVKLRPAERWAPAPA